MEEFLQTIRAYERAKMEVGSVDSALQQRQRHLGHLQSSLQQHEAKSRISQQIRSLESALFTFPILDGICSHLSQLLRSSQPKQLHSGGSQ